MSENNGHSTPRPDAQNEAGGPVQGPAGGEGAGDETRVRGADETVAFGPDEQHTVAFGPAADQTIAYGPPGEPPCEQTLLDATGQGPGAPAQWPQPDPSTQWTGQAASPGAGQQSPWGPPTDPWGRPVQQSQHGYGPYGQGDGYPQNGYQQAAGQPDPYQPYQSGDPYQSAWSAGTTGADPQQDQSGYPQNGYQDQGRYPHGYQQDADYQQQASYQQDAQGGPWAGPYPQGAGEPAWGAAGQFGPYPQSNPQAQGYYDQFGQWIPYQPRKSRSTSRAVVGITIAVLLGLGALTVGGLWARNAANPGSSGSPSHSHSNVQFPVPSSSSSAPTGEQTNANDAQSRGVVIIESELTDATSAGTGMVLSSDGYVLTNYHVVQSSTTIYAKVAITGGTYEATMVGHDATNDIALLKLTDASGLDTVTVDSDAVAVGDSVTAVGNSNGQGYLSAADGAITDTATTVTVESELATSGEETLTDVYETTSQAVPGDSGGPLYDSEGEVTAMTTAGEQKSGYGASSTTLRSWAIPIAKAMSIVDKIKSGDESGTVEIGPKAYLGVNVQESTGGLSVSSVEDDGPAARAGIGTGDRILSVNDTAVATENELSTVLAGLEPGDDTTVEITTATGSSQTVHVTLGESPVN